MLDSVSVESDGESQQQKNVVSPEIRASFFQTHESKLSQGQGMALLSQELMVLKKENAKQEAQITALLKKLHQVSTIIDASQDKIEKSPAVLSPILLSQHSPRSKSLPSSPVVTHQGYVPKRKASLHTSRACTLFCDIVGFTQLNESTEDSFLYNTVNLPLFSAFDRDKKELGIDFRKINGDGYIATIKAKSRQQDRDLLEIMIHFATMMYSSVSQLNLKLQHEHVKIPPIKIRIGIHCGECLDIIDCKTLNTVDVFGRHINIASRMESTVEPGYIQMLEADYRLVKDLFEFDEGHIKPIKGLGDCKVYKLIGFAPKRQFSTLMVEDSAHRTHSYESLLELHRPKN